MRKASQDGGDSTSITSGIENELKKSGPGILKSTKNSIKRKVQSFSTESDDTANEPLLLKSKEKSEIEKQSAKLLISKTKTDYASEKGTDKDKLLADENNTKPSITDVTGITDTIIGNGLKDQKHVTSPTISSVPIHNHMNTNVFNSPDVPKNTTIAKTQILVELDTSKPSRYSPSPLIFTTAKIHTDGRVQQMEPVQVTPVPILSTIEGGLVETKTMVKEFDPKEKKDTTFIPPVTRVATISKLPEKQDLNESFKENVASNASTKSLYFGSKSFVTDNKGKISSPTQNASAFMNRKCSDPHSLKSKITTDDYLRTKPCQPLTNMGARTVENPINVQDLQTASNTNAFASSVKKKITTASIEPTADTTDKSKEDINKNFQSQTYPDSVVKLEDKKPDSKGTSSLSVSNTSSTKEPDSVSSTKGEKIMTSHTMNAKESKLGNNPRNKIAISNVKSIVEEETVNKAKKVSTVKSTAETNSCTNKISDTKSPPGSNFRTEATPSTTMFSVNKLLDKEQTTTAKTASTTSEILSSNKINANKSAENNISKKDTALPVKSISNTTKSSIINTPDKENSEESQSTTKINNLKSPENGISNKESTSSLPSSTTSSVVNNVSLMSISKTSGKEPSLKSSSETNSNLTSVPITSNTKSILTTSVSDSQTMPSVKLSTANVPNISKTPTTSINKTAICSGESTMTVSVNKKISTNALPTVMTTAGNIGSKHKSNNVATVVSSISKPTSTASSTTPTTNTMNTIKSPSTLKQSTSPSTVKTISSIPTAKSAIVSTVPHDKKSTKAAPNTNNDTMSSVSKTQSVDSTIKIQSTAKETGTSTSSAKGVTSSTKPAVKSSTHNETKPSEDGKDSKGSKA